MTAPITDRTDGQLLWRLRVLARRLAAAEAESERAYAERLDIWRTMIERGGVSRDKIARASSVNYSAIAYALHYHRPDKPVTKRLRAQRAQRALARADDGGG